MYIFIKRNKAEHLKDKLYKIKEVIADVVECFEEASEEGKEEDYRYRARREDEWEDDDDRDMARGRGGRNRTRRGSGGGRY